MLATLLLALQAQATPQPVQVPYGTYTIDINGSPETYTISGPTPIPQTPTPLVVLFHGSQGRYIEHPCSWDDYDFVDRATGGYKDWFVVMHDGSLAGCGEGYASYGNEKFQLHTRRVIRRIKRDFAVDEDRIYGYGFSSGGMDALSFAARQQNPQGIMFAGVVSHSGYFMPTYTQGPPGGSYACLYGSDYCIDPFPWQRAGLLDFGRDASCLPLAWPPAVADIHRWTSQVQNFGRMPIRLYYAENEHPATFMRDMNVLLRDTMNTWFPSPTSVSITEFDCTTWAGGCGSTYPDCCDGTCGGGCVPGAKHAWDAVCADAILDEMEPWRLSDYQADVFSTTRVTLAAEDKRYHAIKPTRTPGVDDFGRYGWNLNEVNNRLSLFDVVAAPANIASLTVVLDEFTPLDPLDQVNQLTINNRLGLSVPVSLKDYENGPPQHLLKDGAIKLLGDGWQWDGASETIQITDTALVEWVVVPQP